MQDIVAILIVAVAAAFLVRRAWMTLARRGAGGCGSCSNCPSSGSQQLFTISMDLQRTASSERLRS